MHPGLKDMTEGMNWIEKLEVPRFEDGASPHETAEFFRKIGQPEKAEAAIRGAAQTPDKVVYILTDPGVGGFKKRGVTGVSYVNVNTLGEDFQREVIVHESLHNAHESRWNKIDIPGWKTMTDERRKIVFESLGIDDSFGEISGIEALTQFATQQKIGETESGYDARIVPQGIRLFETLGEKSGRSTVGGFLNMALHGSTGGKQEFADGVRIGTNIMMLERALSGKVFQSEKVVQNMNRVIELQKKNFIVRDLAHAQKLVDSYLEVTGDNGEEELALAA
ncbi:hypothetical protein KA071_00380 [Candidatus Gracilibacteria bacterium]|nr:hypothetical protein [Candidatus Gracilibacteria bacterium]